MREDHDLSGLPARDPNGLRQVDTIAGRLNEKIRDCKFDEPKPDTVPLLQASRRLRVYEVATARVLLDKRLAGDDRSCPYVVTIGADRKIYAAVSIRALVATMRNLVTR